MAKLTLRRKPKSRRLQRKSLGLDKSCRLQRKSRGKGRGKGRGKSRRIGLQRKSRIQRGGRIPTRLEIYTALMLELLDEVYLTYKTPNESQYIKWVFGTPLNFIKCIKARIVEENSDGKSLGEFITTTSYNDSRFAVSNFKLLEQQQKWINFIQSLQERIKNTSSSNIDIGSEVLGRYYDLANPEDIAYLRKYIKNLKEGDGLGRNALDKALDRMIQWQKDQTTGKPTPSHFLKDIIAQVEGDHPTVAAEINKPTLSTNTHTLNFGEELAITPSFEYDSATLYVTIPDGTKMIVNSDVDDSAVNEQGGLKQIHKKQFRYTCKELPFVGNYTFQLIEEYPNEQHKSDPLTITVACAKPAAAEAATAATARPAATAATTRPEAAEAGSTTAAEAEAGAARPAEIEAARPATATAIPAAAAAEARPEAEAGSTTAAEDPRTLPKKTNRFTWFKKPATYQTKIQTNCDILNKILPKYTRRDTSYHQHRVKFLCNFAKTNNDIELLISIHDELNNIKKEYIS